MFQAFTIGVHTCDHCNKVTKSKDLPSATGTRMNQEDFALFQMNLGAELCAECEEKDRQAAKAQAAREQHREVSTILPPYFHLSDTDVLPVEPEFDPEQEAHCRTSTVPQD